MKDYELLSIRKIRAGYYEVDHGPRTQSSGYLVVQENSRRWFWMRRIQIGTWIGEEGFATMAATLDALSLHVSGTIGGRDVRMDMGFNR